MIRFWSHCIGDSDTRSLRRKFFRDWLFVFFTDISMFLLLFLYWGGFALFANLQFVFGYPTVDFVTFFVNSGFIGVNYQEFVFSGALCRSWSFWITLGYLCYVFLASYFILSLPYIYIYIYMLQPKEITARIEEKEWDQLLLLFLRLSSFLVPAYFSYGSCEFFPW